MLDPKLIAKAMARAMIEVNAQSSEDEPQFSMQMPNDKGEMVFVDLETLADANNNND